MREPAKAKPVDSRIAGFYRRTRAERVVEICRRVALDEEAVAHLRDGGGLDLIVADRMSENVVGIHGLPLGLGLNFRVNGRDVIVPMAVEEPSVVAAASNAARMVRGSGGFWGEAGPSIMIAQIQFDDVRATELAAQRLAVHRGRLLQLGDAAIPRIVKRGGGCRGIELRVLDAEAGMLVVHVDIDVGDAMGANIVDTVAEAVAPHLHEILGGTLGLRILSNLPIRRLVRVSCSVTEGDLGGADVADAVVRASRFAELDPYRAVTHNKGFMNGLDAAAVALGQDWRAIEAALHAYVAVTPLPDSQSRYRPVSVWTRTAAGLFGSAEFPLAVGTVGGSTRAHAGVRTAFKLIGLERAQDLAVVLASVGLASNLAALRALASEGIQLGHMKLHRRKSAEVQAPRSSSGDVAPLCSPPKLAAPGDSG